MDTLVLEYSETARGEALNELTWMSLGVAASLQARAMAAAPSTFTSLILKLLQRGHMEELEECWCAGLTACFGPEQSGL